MPFFSLFPTLSLTSHLSKSPQHPPQLPSTPLPPVHFYTAQTTSSLPIPTPPPPQLCTTKFFFILHQKIEKRKRECFGKFLDSISLAFSRSNNKNLQICKQEKKKTKKNVQRIKASLRPVKKF